MRHSFRVLPLTLSLTFSLFTLVAGANEGLTIAVDSPDAEQLRAALDREIASLTPSPQGRLRIQRNASKATVVFESNDGRRLERTIQVQSDPAESAEEIALLAANVLRDDTPPLTNTDALSESASVPVVDSSKAAKSMASPSVPPPKPRPTSEPPPNRVAEETEDSAAQTEPFCEVLDQPSVTFGFDLLPFVGMSSSPAVRNATRQLSLNLIGGYAGGLDGFELGVAFNIQKRFACGLQIAGAANIVGGPVSGGQVAGAVNLTQGPVDAAEVAGAANIAIGKLNGAQIAGGLNLARGYAGLQLAGGLNLSTGAGSGAQIAAININSGEVRGTQIGAVNLAAGKVAGVQIGVVNIAEKSDFSLGVVNVNTRGRTHVDAWAMPEIGLVAAALKHGGDHWHSIYGVATRLSDPKFVGVLGFGGHILVNQHFYVDLDAVGYSIHTFESGNTASGIAQARALVGYRLLDELAVFAGPAYNVQISQSDGPDWSPGYAERAGDSTEPSVHLWPGGIIGVQGIAE